jgi:hypothetical protein
MTQPAPDLIVLSLQGHPGGVVIEGIDLGIQFPPFRTMAIAAGNLEFVSVRGFGLMCRMNEQQHQNRQYQWQDSHFVDMDLYSV